ncbi:unnamed protein product [Brugia pahangi]|uniref:Transmembrane protein n=1 Tax=Brugia pahangi TaxID=6280 RepID=A0A158PST6_BRUPA|nr:unnamed protein product [Brugia pahangi]
MIGKADYKQQMQLLSEGNDHQFYPTATVATTTTTTTTAAAVAVALIYVSVSRESKNRLLTTSRMLLLSILLLLTGMVIMARPPSPDEIKKLGEQRQVNDSKDDYDVLPDVGHIPESFKESLKKQKTLYLEMLRQHNL